MKRMLIYQHALPIAPGAGVYPISSKVKLHVGLPGFFASRGTAMLHRRLEEWVGM